MTGLLEIKEKLKSFYGRYDIYIRPLIKFLLAVCVFGLINGNIGYMSKINNIPVTLVLSLLCSILTVNIMILLAAAVVLVHLYALALEAAVMGAALFMLLAFMYFRFRCV